MKEAKLFTNGQSQAVRLPREFRMAGKSVYIRKIGDVVVLLPKKDPWSVLFDACAKFTPDFLEEREQGVQEREAFLE